MPPPATVSCGNLPGVELPGYGVEARMTGGLNLPNDRQDVGSKPGSLRHPGDTHPLYRAGGVRRAQPFSASLGGR
jgi:hypothetical protein